MASQSYYNQNQNYDNRKPTEGQSHQGVNYQEQQQGYQSSYPPHSQYGNRQEYPPQPYSNKPPEYPPRDSYQQSSYSQSPGYQSQPVSPPPPYGPPMSGYSTQYPPQQAYSPYESFDGNQYNNPNQYNQGYSQAYSPQPVYGQNQGPTNPDDRGFLGTVAGGAAGAYGGHKLHHGIIGGIGGAIAGSMLQDHYKDKKKHDQEQQHQQQQQYYNTSSQPPPHPGRSDGNFSASSEEISLDKDYDLIARCTDVDGYKKLSSINLNDCLTNEWGTLKWARGGGFGHSARNVRLTDGGRVLEAELGDGNNGWKHGSIHLDERITNDDGELKFLG